MLSRFVKAHQSSYDIALKEIKNGRKQSHWMWYIFPQVRGLGRSATSEYYAINSLEEARLFLQDAYLGAHLLEISRALLTLTENDPRLVLGRPDDRKLKSCMTLFAYISEDNFVFEQVLTKYFAGKHDERTLKIIRDNYS